MTAIERDERCLDALAEIEAHYPGRLRIISGDALEQDFKALFRWPEAPHRCQLALQCRHAIAAKLAPDRAMATLLFIDDADVPEGSRRAYCSRSR